MPPRTSRGWPSTAKLGIGEPRIAPWWFPANDHPRDKATYDVVGTVPRGRQFVSNGELVARRGPVRGPSGIGAPPSRWPACDAVRGWPLPDRTGPRRNLRRVQDLEHIEATREPQAAAETPRIISWLQTQFGPYSFGQTGGLVSGTFSNENWSMETQTRPTYPDLTQISDASALIVHELGHQWFGDSVTPHRWRDIWLNEGFARWTEIRYEETNGGRSART